MVEYTTAEAVASYLRLTTADAACGQVAEAVNAYLDGADNLTDDAGTPRASAKLGATMLAARLHRRRNSPAGIESFTADGAAYVTRYDPDAALLLQFDAPGIG